MYRSIVLPLFPVRPSRLSSQNRKQSIQSEHCSRKGREGSLLKSNLTETDNCGIWNLSCKSYSKPFCGHLSNLMRSYKIWLIISFYQTRAQCLAGNLTFPTFIERSKKDHLGAHKKSYNWPPLSPKCNQLCFLLHRNKSRNLAARSKSICIDCRCLAIVSSVNKYWCNHFLPARPLHPGWA